MSHKFLRADVLLQVTQSAGFGRPIKPGNLEMAKANFLRNGEMAHTVQRYSDKDIKDGWHWINAVAELAPKTRLLVVEVD